MSDKNTVVLDGPPSMTGLYARALAGVARSTVGRLPGLGGRPARPARHGARCWATSRCERERVIAYSRVCGFRLRDECPPTYPHMLTFPLQMALMAGSDFPFPAVGLVHIANRIDQHRRAARQERLDLRVWAARPTPTRTRDAGRPAGRGAGRRRARVGEHEHLPAIAAVSRARRRERPSGPDGRATARARAPPSPRRRAPGDDLARSPATSAAATATSPATATRSTCIRSAPSCSGCRARSPTGCG